MSQGRASSQIQDLGLLDIPVMLTLNNANVAETSLLDEAGMGALLGAAFYARGTDRGATAFLIALDHNAAYVNPNFRWFREHRKSFVYIDRVIIAQASRGHGIGRKLYQDLFAAASSRLRALAQPGLLTWRPRASASASGGTFSVITEPAAT